MKEYEIPPEGSLGLLALGAAGITAWRKKRKESGMEDKLLEWKEVAKEEKKKRDEEKKKKEEEKKQEAALKEDQNAAKNPEENG